MYYFLFCLISLLSSPSSRAVVLGQGMSSPHTPGDTQQCLEKLFIVTTLEWKEIFHWQLMNEG